jgi:hypothetical protein
VTAKVFVFLFAVAWSLAGWLLNAWLTITVARWMGWIA